MKISDLERIIRVSKASSVTGDDAGIYLEVENSKSRYEVVTAGFDSLLNRLKLTIRPVFKIGG